jgi:hypothetical protein
MTDPGGRHLVPNRIFESFEFSGRKREGEVFAFKGYIGRNFLDLLQLRKK